MRSSSAEPELASVPCCRGEAELPAGVSASLSRHLLTPLLLVEAGGAERTWLAAPCCSRAQRASAGSSYLLPGCPSRWGVSNLSHAQRLSACWECLLSLSSRGAGALLLVTVLQRTVD